MAVDDLYRMNMCLSGPSGPFTFSLHYRQISGTNDEESGDLAIGVWQADHLPELLLMLSNEIACEEITWTPEEGVNEIPGLLSFGTQNGGIASPPIPLNVCAIISQLTDAPNSNANGRLFLSGITESMMDDGTLSAAGVILVQDFADTLTDTVDVVSGIGQEYTPVVVSRMLNGAPRVPRVLFNVTSATAKIQLRQQRRRVTQKRGLTP